MKMKPFITLLIITGFSLISANSPLKNVSEIETKDQVKKIQLALLLDTSNSMDGLIDQTKAQLWKIVDELANARYDDKPVDLHISLYEYGNDGLSVRSNFIRQVSPFTQDLDEISSLLFRLSTNGGSEYCGAVIKNSLDELEWGTSPNDLRMIFIAGNEPFNQGEINYESVCQKAGVSDIQINTIFCGNYQEGISTFWRKGALIGQGKYMNIDMDQKTVYVPTPYDNRIDILNKKLNDTYIGYGSTGTSRKEQQRLEDRNASTYGQANAVQRAISKSKHVYKNNSWDLVDASKEKDFDLSKIEIEDLPKEMQEMNIEEQKRFLSKATTERAKYQEEIKFLGGKRAKYIQQVQDSTGSENELESAIIKSIKSSAEKKNFKFKN